MSTRTHSLIAVASLLASLTALPALAQEKMHDDKMVGKKTGHDKMQGGKMGKSKTHNKMAGSKMGKNKMHDKMGKDKMQGGKM